MRERYEPALKVACAVLAAVLLFELVRAVVQGNPLGHLTIPALPALAASETTNATPAQGVVKGGAAKDGGAPSGKGATNDVAKGVQVAGKGTNGVGAARDGGAPSGGATNGVAKGAQVAGKGTNGVGAARDGGAPSGKGATNDVAKGVQTASKGTNGVGAARNGGAPSGGVPSGGASGSNAVAGVKSNKGAQKGGGPEMAMMGMNAMMGGPMGRPGGKKGPDLPPAMQARVDKITDSEMLGPVMHPLPMALLGIAGKLAFLRAPSGQTGAVKEGDEVGGLKLLRIGTNRVLVEHEGQKKELTIFSGYGSETLLEKERPNENTTTNKSR